MNPLPEPVVIHPIPAVVVDIESDAFQDKKQGINVHHRLEDSGKIAKKAGIEGEEREDKQPTEDRRDRISGQADLHHLVGKIVVLLGNLLILLEHANQLHHEHKHRDGQYKTAKVEVLLVGHPK